MSDTLTRIDWDKLLMRSTQLKKPEPVPIKLYVCSCYPDHPLLLISPHTEVVAKILRTTVERLHQLAVTARTSGTLQVVMCCHREVAEEILARLQTQLPFIAYFCHNFSMD